MSKVFRKILQLHLLADARMVPSGIVVPPVVCQALHTGHCSVLHQQWHQFTWKWLMGRYEETFRKHMNTLWGIWKAQLWDRHNRTCDTPSFLKDSNIQLRYTPRKSHSSCSPGNGRSDQTCEQKHSWKSSYEQAYKQVWSSWRYQKYTRHAPESLNSELRWFCCLVLACLALCCRRTRLIREILQWKVIVRWWWNWEKWQWNTSFKTFQMEASYRKLLSSLPEGFDDSKLCFQFFSDKRSSPSLIQDSMLR